MGEQNKVGGLLQAASPLLSAIPGVGAILGPAASIIGGLLPPPTSYEPAGEAKGGFGYKKGGTLYYKCGGKMKKYMGGVMSPDLSVLQGGQLNQMSPSTVEVQANTPGALDSVELPQAYVSDDETISQMQDGSKYVFSDVLKNPFSGKTFAEEDKKLAKMEAKVMNKKTKYGKPEQGTLKIINQQREQLAGLNDMMRQLDELKNGTTSVAGKPAAQGGGWLDNLRRSVQDATDMQARGVNNLNMGVFQQSAQPALQGGMRLNPRNNNQVPGPSSIDRVDRKMALREGIVTDNVDNIDGYDAYPIRQVMDDGTIQPDYRYPIAYRNLPPTIPGSTNADGRTAMQVGMPQDSYTQSTTQALSQSPRTAQAVQGGTTPTVGKKTAGKKANPKAAVAKSTTPNWMQGFQGSTQTATGGYDRVDPTTGVIMRSAAGVDPFQYYPNMPSLTAQLPTIKVGYGGKPLQSMTGKKLGALTKDGHMLARPGGSTVTNKAGGQGAGNIFGNANINHLLQFGELASKAALLLRGYDRPQQNTAPISYSPMDPSNALMQNQYAFNAAQQDLNNSSSGATLNANVQQLAANKMRGNAQIMTQYDNMNKDLFRDYQARLGQRAAENIQYKHIGQADEAAYYNQMYDILTSVGNIGRAGQASKDNKNAVQLIIQSYPQIAQYMTEAFKNMKLNIPT